eukprot:CAMPEP_0181184868 /NCGR_PEP_ID=MMETSP1096-20121128/9202_1 /TAXON_ID=156174 ORGANISM="Chrysochromulina ericina, Strain CCMP281" /NCGR_SAMPLE_ID=MMETSP1096 /ASSEMBLY_ACC=CAM_ASM_000453 /LENGTH=215 /DNA_ID=CAMNT_0023273671 /DNA_START=293 /DNA_END=941 /DNA_ORIENTATION=+
MIDDLVESGVPSTKIVLGGFSQGGTLSILCGLTYSKPLGGVVSISGWAAYREALPSKVSDANKQLPMLFSVGTADPVVSFALGSASGQILRQVLGDSVSVSHVQRGMHQPDQAEMGAAGQFKRAACQIDGYSSPSGLGQAGQHDSCIIEPSRAVRTYHTGTSRLCVGAACRYMGPGNFFPRARCAVERSDIAQIPAAKRSLTLYTTQRAQCCCTV